jgi:hypothetical protein
VSVGVVRLHSEAPARGYAGPAHRAIGSDPAANQRAPADPPDAGWLPCLPWPWTSCRSSSPSPPAT